MTTQTYTERLALVRQAIDKIISGSQSWRFGDRQYTRADLDTLQRMETHYAKMAGREQAIASGRRGRNRIRHIGF
ncbi:Phage tail protein [Halomonas sp. NYA30]